MKRAFPYFVVLLLGIVMADRAQMHAQAGGGETVGCVSAADLVKSNALATGFPQAAADSQREGFLSRCLISGQGRVGELVARN